MVGYTEKNTSQILILTLKLLQNRFDLMRQNKFIENQNYYAKF